MNDELYVFVYSPTLRRSIIVPRNTKMTHEQAYDLLLGEIFDLNGGDARPEKGNG